MTDNTDVRQAIDGIAAMIDPEEARAMLFEAVERSNPLIAGIVRSLVDEQRAEVERLTAVVGAVNEAAALAGLDESEHDALMAIQELVIGEHGGSEWVVKFYEQQDRIVSLERERDAAQTALADDIRARGWTVAIHNDYRQAGEAHTFWLFTKGNRCVKGEGLTDAEALNQVRAIIARRDAT